MEIPTAYKAISCEDTEQSFEFHKSTKNKLTRDKCLSHLKKNILVVCMIISMMLGIALGACLKLLDPPLTTRQQVYLRFPGEIFMNMLQLIILPLVVSSLISGLASLDSRASGKLGARAVLYYLTTTMLAAILGIVLVLSIRPGDRGSNPDVKDLSMRKMEVADTFLDLIRQMFPNNIVEACFRKRQTYLEKENLTKKEINQTLYDNKTMEQEYKPVLQYTEGINMLGLVVFSLSLGIAINRLGEKGRPLKELIVSLNEAILVLISAVISYSPIGVLFLVAAQIVEMDDPANMFAQLGYYFITVMAGLAIHGLAILPSIYFFPFKFILGMLQAMITAVGTSSSSATLPVTMRNLEENNGIDPRITSFVAPVGATVNMDGTALYEAVAVIFIGQVRGYELDIGNIITICLTATAAAIGAASVPQSGLVTMVIVLSSVGFPADGIGMILAVDWLLDRFRTMVNVLGDAFGAGIVHHFSKEDLERMALEDKQNDERNDHELTSVELQITTVQC